MILAYDNMPALRARGEQLSRGPPYRFSLVASAAPCVSAVEPFKCLNRRDAEGTEDDGHRKKLHGMSLISPPGPVVHQ